MGCWKEIIYGGDTPLEFREKIYKICGVEEYGSNNKVQPIPDEIIDGKMSEITSLINESEGDDVNIGFLVLGAIIMHSGANLDEETKGLILTAADEDEWSKENQVRKNVIKIYKNTLNDYSPSNPIDVESINFFDEVDDTEEDVIAHEFKTLFTIMNARIKNRKKNIEEKSGVKEYDEGYADASQEEIDFLTDFKEMIEKQEQLAIIFERIENEINTSSFSIVEQKFSNNHFFGSGSMSGGNDIMTG
jgi:hypothetical protein